MDALAAVAQQLAARKPLGHGGKDRLTPTSISASDHRPGQPVRGLGKAPAMGFSDVRATELDRIELAQLARLAGAVLDKTSADLAALAEDYPRLALDRSLPPPRQGRN